MMPAPERRPMARREFGMNGKPIQLYTNHYNVRVTNNLLIGEQHLYHYTVAVTCGYGYPVMVEGLQRKILDKVHQTYHQTELAGKDWAFDGDYTLITVGELPEEELELTVVLEEDNTEFTYKVLISYAAKTSLLALASLHTGKHDSGELLRALNSILRHLAAKQGELLFRWMFCVPGDLIQFRRMFFCNRPTNFTPIGDGLIGCRGFRSTFEATQEGLSLRMDVSTTLMVQPGPVIDFLVANQDAPSPRRIDWEKAKRTLRNLRIAVEPSGDEYKIVGLTNKICREQTFVLTKNGVKLSVYDYFVNYKEIALMYSGEYPCITVGNPKRPLYFPLELCNLVSMQRYTKSRTNLQRASLVKISRLEPLERMDTLTNALSVSNCCGDPVLASCGISIRNRSTIVQGRVLPAPELKVGLPYGKIFPKNGKWSYKDMKMIEPKAIHNWAIISFATSARSPKSVNQLTKEIIDRARRLGMHVSEPLDIVIEDPRFSDCPAHVRVELIYQEIMIRLSKLPEFLLCILPEQKNSDIYGPWKKKITYVNGVATQCICPTNYCSQAMTNIALKINAKMGGINFQLPSMPIVTNYPTLIVGMTVLPGNSRVPSIAAVVGSRGWPGISHYRPVVRTQSPKVALIDSLCQRRAPGTQDTGMFREVLLDFFEKSGHRKPEQIIIFRDGVSESQFTQVLNTELDQIIEACKLFDDDYWYPSFLFVVAQKNHHTRFFQADDYPFTLPPGTVVDSGVCHPRNNDFYLCAHSGVTGTTRPTHYHVLHDELGYAADDLQNLVHNLSYGSQRSTTAISIVAPIRYAKLAAAQMSQFIKSAHESVPLNLNKIISEMMYFC